MRGEGCRWETGEGRGKRWERQNSNVATDHFELFLVLQRATCLFIFGLLPDNHVALAAVSLTDTMLLPLPAVLTPALCLCRQVDEAQSIMRLCDKLKDERDRLKRNNESSVWHQVGGGTGQVTSVTRVRSGQVTLPPRVRSHR